MAKKQIDRERRETIAQELRAHRARSQMTQAEVASTIGIDKGSIGRYELGETCIDYETAWAMADLYGVSLDELGGRKAPAPQGDAV